MKTKFDYLAAFRSIYPEKNGVYTVEIFADYRDVMDRREAGEILRDSDPETALDDRMREWYFASEAWYIDEIKDTLRKEFEAENDFDENNFEEAFYDFQDEIEIIYPAEHFLNQTFHVNIVMDTGDANYDFVLNHHFPSWGGDDGPIDEKASLLWLAKAQGYSEEQLRAALNAGDIMNPRGFLESCRQEMANLPSVMSTVVFLVEMSLRDLIKVNRAISFREKDGRLYDPEGYPDCGAITLDKSTMCGLFDGWDGGGSVLEIELEEDIVIPIKYIYSIMPDGENPYFRYDVDNVYGLCGSAWRDTVKKIEIPEETIQ